jgi:drug/metabolite transporter (DMT)-like permease
MHLASDKKPEQSPRSLLVLTVALALLAFAGNSLLTRAAMQQSLISEALFATVRLCSGALVLCLLLSMRSGFQTPLKTSIQGHWRGAAALLTYVVGFTWAYREMSAATGALILFAAVQVTMIGWSVAKGRLLHWMGWLGLICAMAGLVLLLLPGLHTPPWSASLYMGIAGVAWGVYSLLGQSSKDPLATTAGHFLRASPVALALLVLASYSSGLRWDHQGLVLAALSGGITSGLGYALWYRVLPSLRVQTSASLQLSVPLITTLGGLAWLGESPSMRLWLASAAIVIGIGLVIRSQQSSR